MLTFPSASAGVKLNGLMETTPYARHLRANGLGRSLTYYPPLV